MHRDNIPLHESEIMRKYALYHERSILFSLLCNLMVSFLMDRFNLYWVSGVRHYPCVCLSHLSPLTSTLLILINFCTYGTAMTSVKQLLTLWLVDNSIWRSSKNLTSSKDRDLFMGPTRYL